MKLKIDEMVSVVIATYNMGKYLSEAIKSVLLQTYQNIELIVIDDGSTDNTKKVVQKFMEDKRLKYKYQSNSGQAKAKNNGIVSSQGKYVAFLDGDDIWIENKIEKQLLAMFKKNEVGVVYTGLSYIDENSEIFDTPKIRGIGGKITNELLIDNFVTGMTSLVRRECFEKVGVFDEGLEMGIDYDLWLRISLHYDFLYLDEVTYLYRIWPGQMSKNFKKRCECAEVIMNRFIKENYDVLNKQSISKAWAHYYVSKGRGLLVVEKDRYGSLRCLIRALKNKVWYIQAWKAIFKLVLQYFFQKVFKLP